jgi:hypothetical protein
MDEEQKQREKRLPESSPPGLFYLDVIDLQILPSPKQETEDGYGLGHVHLNLLVCRTRRPSTGTESLKLLVEQKTDNGTCTKTHTPPLPVLLQLRSLLIGVERVNAGTTSTDASNTDPTEKG